jgi:hypothetical protein
VSAYTNMCFRGCLHHFFAPPLCDLLIGARREPCGVIGFTPRTIRLAPTLAALALSVLADERKSQIMQTKGIAIVLGSLQADER